MPTGLHLPWIKAAIQVKWTHFTFLTLWIWIFPSQKSLHVEFNSLSYFESFPFQHRHHNFTRSRFLFASWPNGINYITATLKHTTVAQSSVHWCIKWNESYCNQMCFSSDRIAGIFSSTRVCLARWDTSSAEQWWWMRLQSEISSSPTLVKHPFLFPSTNRLSGGCELYIGTPSTQVVWNSADKCQWLTDTQVCV